MGGFKTFEEMKIWQEAKFLTVQVYKDFNQIKDWGFKDQIQRASISIMNNIAEGSKRQSNTEFKKFLHYANGSTIEVRSMILLAYELEYLQKEVKEDLYKRTERISAGITSLIHHLKLSSTK